VNEFVDGATSTHSLRNQIRIYLVLHADSLYFIFT